MEKLSHKKTTVITGANGAGKTTTIFAILKLIQFDEGKIYLENINTAKQIPIEEIEKTTFHNQITWVCQTPVIFQGTILENIQSFTNNYSIEQIEQAASNSGLLEVINTLPEKWQTQIGTKGIGLSLGQRQKIALTKALLEDKQIIIFDEPTAHLDTQSEKHIIRTIQKLQEQEKTIIIIAHKQSLINLADNEIIVEAEAK